MFAITMDHPENGVLEKATLAFADLAPLLGLPVPSLLFFFILLVHLPPSIPRSSNNSRSLELFERLLDLSVSVFRTAGDASSQFLRVLERNGLNVLRLEVHHPGLLGSVVPFVDDRF